MKRSVSLLLPDDVDSGTRTRSVSMSSSSPTSFNKQQHQQQASKARKTNSLPAETVDYLKSWMMSPEHIAHPYPTDIEKAQIMADTGIELKQLTNWFVNNRKRFWKPRVESRLVQEGGGVSTQAAAPLLVTPEQSGKSIVPMDSLSLKSVMMTGFLDDTTKSVISPSSSSSSLNSPMRVSDQSVMSETDSLSSSDGSASEDELLLGPSTSGGQDSNEEATNLIAQTEQVNVHILRPVLGNAPTLDDVTVLNNVPSDRVLKSYLNCTLTYMIPTDAINNSNEIQRRREEVIRKLKLQYLEDFIASQPSSPKRRRYTADEAVDSTPRRNFRRPSLDLWREACSSSDSFYDKALPSLEEAAALFGFASS